MSVISRSEWGARSPRSSPSYVSNSSRQYVVFHHTTGSHLGNPNSYQWVNNIQDYHMDTKGWNDIGYNGLFDYQGRRFDGRGLNVVGAHVAHHNVESIGFAFLGDGNQITEEALIAAQHWYDDACNKVGRTLPIRGHRDFGSTNCPGDGFYSKLDDFSIINDLDEAAMIYGLSEGDKGPRVGILQHWIRRAGYGDMLLYDGGPENGVDDDYGSLTTKAVYTVRKEAGSTIDEVQDGNTVTKYTPGQIIAIIAKREAEKVVHALIDDQNDG